MPLQLLAALSLFAFVASITPGPNNIMLLASGVKFGFVRTLPHMFGVGIGFMIMIMAVGLGIDQAFKAFPILYTVLKWVSVVYMVWLAWKIANAGPIKGDASGTEQPMTFLAAALFQWVNPKAWAMILTAVTAYTVPANFLVSLLIMTAIFGAINIPCISCWTGFGVVLRDMLRDPARVKVFNYTMAALLVASLIPVLLGLE
jgi:threonine/homoserine/homoserine lactone efflux protein